MFGTPLSSKYTINLAKKLLDPVKRGESVFVRWFPGHGKIILLSQIFSDEKLLEKNLGSFYKKYILVRVDSFIFSNLEISDIFVNIQNTLVDKLKERKILSQNSIYSPYHPSFILTIKNIIELSKQTISAGWEIVFLINDIDDFTEEKLKDLFQGLNYIVESNRERIHTHINVNKLDIIEKNVTRAALIQNIINIPLPDHDECLNFINFYLEKWEFKLSSLQKDKIFDICGNNLGLIKEAIRLFKINNDVDLLNEPTLYIKAKIDYGLFGDNEKKVIENKLKTSSITPANRILARRLATNNFWKIDYQIPKIFTQVIFHSSNIKELNIDGKDNILKFGDINLKKILSDSEYNVLILLYRKKGKVVSRDDIAETLWKEKMLDLYSDWAIDKAISRLRNKLGNLTFYYQINSKKKEGFFLDI